VLYSAIHVHPSLFHLYSYPKLYDVFSYALLRHALIYILSWFPASFPVNICGMLSSFDLSLLLVSHSKPKAFF
jgi:hypothetical protein